MTTKNFHNHLGKWEQMLSHFGTCPIAQNWFIYYYLLWSSRTGFGHHKIIVNADSINSKPICNNQAAHSTLTHHLEAINDQVFILNFP